MGYRGDPGKCMGIGGTADGQISHPWFRALVGYLEQAYGFQGVRYRNDMDFSPLQAAPEIIETIFGEDGVQRLREHSWVMPECEGMWWKAAPF